MSHIALQEVLDGKVVDWMEDISDEQYGARWRLHDEAPGASSPPSQAT